MIMIKIIYNKNKVDINNDIKLLDGAVDDNYNGDKNNKKNDATYGKIIVSLSKT